MSFFENQHLARRNTRVMVLLFVLAVVGVVLAVDLVCATAYLFYIDIPQGTPYSATLRLVPRTLYVWSSIATVALILAVSTFNVTKLGGGGDAVAQMVGARRVASGTGDALERRLLNVVEEMAIAAGVRVPGVYVMDGERGINAFAAGWDAPNAVVAVTRGTLEALTRDELQGVIGHEFSHILNGDVRLNIRMIGLLAGILFIGSIGQFVMRNVRESRDSKGVGQLFLVGLALFIIGYVGLFFARLIKAAVSRQREFLADASSVQFTRNPDGIAGALDQMRSSGAGALISGRYAEEMSHMFFGQSVRLWLGGIFDTHPPLDERIRRINPRFQATPYRKARASAAEPPVAGGAMAFAGAPQATGRRPGDAGAAWGRSAGDSAKLVGTLDASKIGYAARLLASLPAGLRESLRDADGARAATIALLLAPKDEVMRAQLQAMQAAGLGTIAERAAAAAALIRGLGPAYHLALVDLALPALKSAPDAAKRQLMAALEAVINADRRVSLHEFVVLTLVRHQLAPKEKPPSGGSKLAALQADVAIVLSLLAHAGTRADASGARAEALRAAMRAGVKEMGLPELEPAAVLTLDAASAALGSLKRLAPLQKALLVKGLFAAVLADGTIRMAEAELMRLVGAVLDCPLPPMLDELDPVSLAA